MFFYFFVFNPGDLYCLGYNNNNNNNNYVKNTFHITEPNILVRMPEEVKYSMLRIS